MRTFKLKSTVFLAALFLTSSALLFSCKNSDKKDDKKKEELTDKSKEASDPEAADFVNAKSWPYFKLDRVKIEELIARPDHHPLEFRRHQQIVLQHALVGITDDGKVSVRLLGTALQNAAPHGRLRESFEINPEGRYKDLDYPVILGNNRLDWNTIGEIIFERMGPAMGKLKADFSYILFEPMVTYDNTQHAGCTMCKGHLWYKMTAYKTDGNPYPGWGGGGSGSTNPSPPAEPGL